jgi:hypothetical protein
LMLADSLARGRKQSLHGYCGAARFSGNSPSFSANPITANQAVTNG